MYYTVGCAIYGVCPAIDYSKQLKGEIITVMEDLRDALPYLYEKHFGKEYGELSWYLEPGAKEFVKDLEDKWMHNKLDLSEVYKDEEFLKSLAERYSTQLSRECIEDIQDEFEDMLRDELTYLDTDELKELYEYDDTVDYDIEDEDGNIIAIGFVCLPDLEDDDEEEDD